ncbi:hypothetical protein KCP76_10900 [Salmonella enterica subsp. enterica serovar Weltevreden]|nr:hypothetical protein KCP76_10900 [Salmonella enterica subsp. enterica serovar Weltevreden]
MANCDNVTPTFRLKKRAVDLSLDKANVITTIRFNYSGGKLASACFTLYYLALFLNICSGSIISAR